MIPGGEQPVWTTARACGRNLRLRLKAHTAIVSACAPRPGRLTVTRRRDGTAVTHKTVRAATGRLVKVRFSRPAGKLSAQARFSG